MSEELENEIIGNDLCKLAEKLISYGLCDDTSALNTAGQQCLNPALAPNTWSYNLEKIVFKIDPVGGQLPFNSEDISISLSIKISGSIYDNIKNIQNPLNSLLFDIEIEGFRENVNTQDVDVLYSSWHLDRHIFSDGDGTPKYSHPLYHFTYGGDKMEAKGDIYGNCIVLPTPRIAYPPMDAILGIDFILQNYFHKEKISDIIQDTEYIEMIQRAQERLLKPYYSSIMSYWDKESYKPVNDFSYKMLFPLFY